MANVMQGLFTTEDVTAALRGKNDTILGVYARVVAMRDTAQRMHRLAVSAADAYCHHSHDEAMCCLRAMQHVIPTLEAHVDASLCGISDAQMDLPEPRDGDYERLFGERAR